MKALKTLSWQIEFVKPYFLFLTNNFRANPLAFCKFILVYIFGKPRVRVGIEARFWAEVGVYIWKTIKKGVTVLLPLVMALINSFLRPKKELLKVYKMTIWSAKLVFENICKISIFLIKLVNLLGKEFLEL